MPFGRRVNVQEPRWAQKGGGEVSSASVDEVENHTATEMGGGDIPG